MITSLLTNKQQVPHEFNKVARRYDFATYLSQGYQEDLDYSATLMGLSGTEQVLDLCCGTGKSTLACLQVLPQGTITGVDNSSGMLSVADAKLQSEIETGRVSLHLGDAMELDFPDASFDAVFMAYGLRNMPDYARALEGISRVLRPGGVLCIHDYSLAPGWWVRLYWAVLGYGFIVPFCTLLSGSADIYLYLIRSVLTFLSPQRIEQLCLDHGFTQAATHRHKSWRRPILHTIIARRA
ncbi:MAG: class I SAM-dependent methyltransferase [Bacteroidetes bacterium]|nr:class I SAM-dependent methyltransferase [Bacteroidota bacterium]